MTPAVEPVDILTRGGNIWDKQVYWLYGLAQGNTDTKDYALHFDLTVPFARYVLDHMNDLVFPFKRYQMQPVWRGERTKRGRYKEFWQFDIDIIRRSEISVWSWYDAESIIVCYQALQDIFLTMWIEKKIIVKLSHIWLTKTFLTTLGIEWNNLYWLCSLLDDYFKIWHTTFIEKALQYADSSVIEKVSHLLQTHDYSSLIWVEWYEQLHEIITQLKQYNVNVQYDIAIIRWHNYYTWAVVEFFLEDDMELGAIAWGWAYQWLTDFIDKKRSFSWVWCSISSRIMEVILSLWWWLQTQSESFLFIHFDDAKDATIRLMQQFHGAWKSCEFYPIANKLAKQFEYADKKWITHCVVYWAGEQEKKVFVIKNMKSGESYVGTFDESFGVIPVCIIDWVKKILMIKHTKWHRWFPKWHAEIWEADIVTAVRECQEEVGLQYMTVHQGKKIVENYFVSDRKNAVPQTALWTKNILKTVTYFVADVQNPAISLQPDEVVDAQWRTLEEAQLLPMFDQMRGILKQLSHMIIS